MTIDDDSLGIICRYFDALVGGVGGFDFEWSIMLYISFDDEVIPQSVYLRGGGLGGALIGCIPP